MIILAVLRRGICSRAGLIRFKIYSNSIEWRQKSELSTENFAKLSSSWVIRKSLAEHGCFKGITGKSMAKTVKGVDRIGVKNPSEKKSENGRRSAKVIGENSSRRL